MALIVYAKCLSSHCKTNSFSLPIKGIVKYQKATARFINEAIASNVLNNTSSDKVKERFARSFNTTGSRPTIDRWKHKEANKLNFKNLIEKLKHGKNQQLLN